MKMVAKKQIQIIHIAKAQLERSLPGFDYGDILSSRYGKESSKDLTYAQAHDLIEHFKALGFKLTPRNRPRHRRERLPGNVVLLASAVQTDMIERLKEAIAWQYEDGYERWLRRFMRISAVRTAAEAQKIIEGLKGLLRNQQKAQQNITGGN